MKVYLLTIGAIIALPFLTIWKWIYRYKYLILQMLWTLFWGILGGLGFITFIAGTCGINILIALVGFWCYISCTTLAFYDYNYAIRRWF